MSRLYFCSFIIIMALCVFGCSGDSFDNPATMNGNFNDLHPDQNIDIPDSQLQQPDSPVIMGVYEVEIDPINLTANIHPLRMSSQLGDTYHVNITPYLTSVPCADCVNFSSIAIHGDYLDVDVQTKHPYQPLNRFDLHVFDMRGIIVTGDNIKQFEGIEIDLDGDNVYESRARGNVDFLVNPDGFTSFYDSVVEQVIGKHFEGTICPFKNLWVDPQTKPPATNYDPIAEPQYGFKNLLYPTGHNVFPMGGTFGSPFATTSFRFDFSNLDSTTFIYILEASYGHTTTRLNRLEPRYFLPEFHCKDPWSVKAEIINNTLKENAPDSSATIHLEVMDWQAGLIPNPTWNYSTSDLTDIRFASDVRGLTIEIPGVLQSLINLGLPDKTSGNGSPDSPYVWDIEITNETDAGFGSYWGLVAVRDDLEGTSNGPFGVATSTSLPLILNDITTYQAFEISIAQNNIPPVAELIDNDADNVLDSGEIVNFQPGLLTGDPDGQIIRYEYDFDYNGTDFLANITQNSGDGDFGAMVNHQFVNSGMSDTSITVALRVTDNGTPGLTDIDTVTFTVHPSNVLYLFEDFESTTGSELPAGWGITGRYSDAYFLNTLGEGCRGVNWKWGVTVNQSQCEAPESHFLNETGFNHPNLDETYVFQNRATIAYTPEFTIPATGATLTIRHWFDFTYEELFTLTIDRDGGQPILSINNPGTVEWTDFCYALEENNHPRKSLSIVEGPVGYGWLPGYVSDNHPFSGWSCHTGNSEGWITSSYAIPSILAGQTVRIGFLFGSDDIRSSIPDDCDPNEIGPTVFARPGWRINWIKIQSN
ncbi:MAG: hypothetical protein ABIG42_06930 [bacterium]